MTYSENFLGTMAMSLKISLKVFWCLFDLVDFFFLQIESDIKLFIIMEWILWNDSSVTPALLRPSS